MNRCRIVGHAIPGPGGVYTAGFRCETHAMPMENPQVTTQSGDEIFCPIGRIEQATEKAIERINAAAQVKA